VRAGEPAPIGAQIEASPAFVRAGETRLVLVNDTSTHQVVRLERAPRTGDSLAAAAAMTHPTFQSFFSDELLPEGQHLRVGRMAFVAIDVEDRVRVLQSLGDAATFARFAEIVTRVTEIAEREHGVVGRAMFDGILCAFSSSAGAVRAAFTVMSSLAEEGGSFEKKTLPVRIAVHAGRCIAVSRGARIEYFGETIERTTGLLADARAGVVAVSSAVDDEPAALAAMLATGVTRTVGTSRAGEFGGRRVTWLARTAAG
jgi:class 3 adenylate cyclase